MRPVTSQLHNGGNAVTQPRPTVAVSALVQGVAGGLGWSSMAAALGHTNFGASERALVWSAGPLGIAIASLAGGRAVDHWGARRVGSVGLLVGALACAARAGASSAFALAACMLFFGAQIGFVAPAISRVMFEAVTASRVSSANRALLPLFGLGTLASFFVVGDDWASAMVVIGGAMGVVALIWWFATPAASVHQVTLGSAELRGLLANPGVRRVAAMQFLVFGSYLAVIPQLGVLRGTSDVVGWLCAAVVGNVVAARMSDALGLRRPFVLAGAAVSGLGGLGLTLGLGVPALLAFGFGGGLVASVVISLPLELSYVGAPRLGAALGLVLMFGQLGGVVLALVGAVVLQHFGASVFFGFFAVAHLLILFPALRLAETGPRARIHPTRVDFDGAAA
jgi:MFS family permease